MLYEDREARVLAFLDAQAVAYTLLHHAPAYTMDDCRDIVHEKDVAYCKNLFLSNRQRTQFFLYSLREDRVFRTSDISHQLGASRLSFAPDALLPDLLGLLPGAVSPFGLLFDEEKRVRLVLDDALVRFPRIAFHPCVNTATVILSTSDFIHIVLPALAHTPAWVRAGAEDEERSSCENTDSSCPISG